MHCEYSVVDADRDGEVVEDVSVVLPHHCVSVLGLALHVESVVLSNGSGLVVASDHGHFVGVLYFEQTKQSDNFDAVCPSVHIIPQK